MAQVLAVSFPSLASTNRLLFDASISTSADSKPLHTRSYVRNNSSLCAVSSSELQQLRSCNENEHIPGADVAVAPAAPLLSRRFAVAELASLVASGALVLCGVAAPAGECAVAESRPKFHDLDGSGGVKALDIREGSGGSPGSGDRVEIHYYGRLAAKQGWRFDSTYDHKDKFGNPEPYVFTVGDGSVIGGMDAAVRSMREGGVRRVVIPPSLGYQNTSQGPVPPDYFDRQRLYTTIFNQTRLANGEGDTLGTLIFDIELLKIRRPQ